MDLILPTQLIGHVSTSMMLHKGITVPVLLGFFQFAI